MMQQSQCESPQPGLPLSLNISPLTTIHRPPSSPSQSQRNLHSKLDLAYVLPFFRLRSILIWIPRLRITEERSNLQRARPALSASPLEFGFHPLA
ncbi:hypothetical protein CBOM_07721 [Ceraceosorus bombacis]|uniref:Uncharacterized protein n=1 Tax=Ceraceosorus bombacis TaxID=401625 RepID=A0A0P1BH14_9BASI|nr:hypothetical protein CBOM_07721 [Ceraceosorus bombacis]